MRRKTLDLFISAFSKPYEFNSKGKKIRAKMLKEGRKAYKFFSK